MCNSDQIRLRKNVNKDEDMKNPKRNVSPSSSDETPMSSPLPSSTNLKDAMGVDVVSSSREPKSNDTTNSNSATSRPKRSLKARSRPPPSFYLSLALLIIQAYTSNVLKSLPSVLAQVGNSITTSLESIVMLIHDLFELFNDTLHGQFHTMEEYISHLSYAFLAVSFIYVLIIGPMKAGMWTGKRATRQRVHRFMGLAYLIQYGLAWVQFLTNYEDGYQHSYLPYTIALNGLIQVHSAYFSFRVLPDLKDAGYYSDRGTISRLFIHENSYFQLMSLFGSLYYIDGARDAIKGCVLGRLLEGLFIFWPYVLIRPLFPVTRFSDAGSSSAGRTEKNERFYEIGTTMIKIFYLWAKYYLGFFINFVVYLNLVNNDTIEGMKHKKLIQGLFLLNVGTVSLGVFLHTLRFKKVFPPRVTFVLYLGQIYATFASIPLCLSLFSSHLKLVALCGAGLLGNLTRSKKVHAAWCAVTMYLLLCTDNEW